jgi:hypothetical protein
MHVSSLVLSRYLAGLVGVLGGATRSMRDAATPPSSKRYRASPAIIAHAVWLCFRCALRYRDVAERLVECGATLLGSFDGPARAVRCAQGLVRAAGALGLVRPAR